MSQPDSDSKPARFLEGLPKTERNELLSVSTLCRYSDKVPIFSCGEALPGVFVVSRGGIKVFRSTGKNKIQVLQALAPGQCIGEVELLSGKKAVSSARAIGHTECWLVPSGAMLESIRQNPIVSEAITQSLIKKILHLVPLVEALGLHSVGERTAQLISDRLDMTPDRKIIEFPEKQVELAQYIGASREGINRALKQLSGLGIIKSTFPVVRITNVKKLKKFLNK